MVVADRNFGVFSVAYPLSLWGHPCLFRMTDQRAKRLNGQKRGSLARPRTRNRLDSEQKRPSRTPRYPRRRRNYGRIVIRHVLANKRRVKLILFVSDSDLCADELVRALCQTLEYRNRSSHPQEHPRTRPTEFTASRRPRQRTHSRSQRLQPSPYHRRTGRQASRNRTQTP